MISKKMLFILNNAEETLYSIEPLSIKRTREIKGFSQLEFETDIDISNGKRVIFLDMEGIWNEYIIFDIETIHDSNGVVYNVYCEDSTSELINVIHPDKTYEDCTPKAALSRVIGATRFKEGFVDDGPSLTFSERSTNAKESLLLIAERYGMEINVRTIVENNQIVGRYIDMVYNAGQDNGKRFAYKKDLVSVKKHIDNSQLLTLLYVHGAYKNPEDGEEGKTVRIDIRGVNGTNYITNEEARLKYGLGPEKKHITGSITYDSVEDPYELLRLGQKELAMRSQPKITYELEVVDLYKLLGLGHEKTSLGDLVIVSDEEIGELIRTRVIKIEDNPLSNKNESKITLGDVEHNWEDNKIIKKEVEKDAQNSHIKSIKSQVEKDKGKIKDIENKQKDIEGKQKDLEEKQKIIYVLTKRIDDLDKKINGVGGDTQSQGLFKAVDFSVYKHKVELNIDKTTDGFGYAIPNTWLKLDNSEEPSQYVGSYHKGVVLYDENKSAKEKTYEYSISFGAGEISWVPKRTTYFTDYEDGGRSKDSKKNVYQVDDYEMYVTPSTKFFGNVKIDTDARLELENLTFIQYEAVVGGDSDQATQVDGVEGIATTIPAYTYIDQSIYGHYLYFELYTCPLYDPGRDNWDGLIGKDPYIHRDVWNDYPGFKFESGFVFSFDTGTIYYKEGRNKDYKIVATCDPPIKDRDGHNVIDSEDFFYPHYYTEDGGFNFAELKRYTKTVASENFFENVGLPRK